MPGSECKFIHNMCIMADYMGLVPKCWILRSSYTRDWSRMAGDSCIRFLRDDYEVGRAVVRYPMGSACTANDSVSLMLICNEKRMTCSMEYSKDSFENLKTFLRRVQTSMDLRV